MARIPRPTLAAEVELSVTTDVRPLLAHLLKNAERLEPRERLRPPDLESAVVAFGQTFDPMVDEAELRSKIAHRLPRGTELSRVGAERRDSRITSHVAFVLSDLKALPVLRFPPDWAPGRKRPFEGVKVTGSRSELVLQGRPEAVTPASTSEAGAGLGWWLGLTVAHPVAEHDADRVAPGPTGKPRLEWCFPAVSSEAKTIYARWILQE